MSFGDCLPEEEVPGPGVKLTNCKLTAKSALMIVLSLATSAAYFGCKHGHVRWKLPFKCSIETSIRQFRWLCRQSRPDPAHRRALARGEGARRPSPVVRPGWQRQRDGHAGDSPHHLGPLERDRICALRPPGPSPGRLSCADSNRITTWLPSSNRSRPGFIADILLFCAQGSTSAAAEAD
jgi:hypothetical protein